MTDTGESVNGFEISEGSNSSQDSLWLALVKSKVEILGSELGLEKEKFISQLEQVFSLYQNGGEIGGVAYQPLDGSVGIHGVRHVMIQVGAAMEVARLLPSDRNDDKQALVYSALLHEIGYLSTQEERNSGELDVYHATNHKERGVEVGEKLLHAWGLSGLQTKVRDNVEATRLGVFLEAGREYKVADATDLNDLPLEEVAHLIDLLAYTLDEDYVPDGILQLFEEMQVSLKGLASSKIATKSRAQFVNNKFMLPDSEPFGARLAQFVGLLKASISSGEDKNELKVMTHEYQKSIESLKAYDQLVICPKRADLAHLETSVELWRLGQWCQDNNHETDFKRIIKQLHTGVLGDKKDKFKTASAAVLRQISDKLGTSQHESLIRHLLEGEREDQKSQSIGKSNIVLTPAAWLFEAGGLDPDDLESLVDQSSQILEMFLKVTKDLNQEPGETHQLELVVGLRREDGEDFNSQLLGKILDSNPGASVMIEGGQVAGEEQTMQLVKQFNQARGPTGQASLAIVWGQAGKQEGVEVGTLAPLLTLLRPGDRLVYSYGLVGQLYLLDQVIEKGVVVVVSPAALLESGFSLSEIRDFLARFTNRPDLLELVSSNNTREGDLTSQMLKWIKAGIASLDEVKSLLSFENDRGLRERSQDD